MSSTFDQDQFGAFEKRPAIGISVDMAGFVAAYGLSRSRRDMNYSS